jgi:ABC-type antimicrobial peptide transport system permease subunit
MGRVLVIGRLARRDMCRRPTEALLLLAAIAVAASTLTLGLVLHGLTTQPYAQTRVATHGPDIVAESASTANFTTTPGALAALRKLGHASWVAASSGPYPMTTVVLRTPSVTAGANVEGRDAAPASVDQPVVTAGTWVRPGGVVVERAFADAAGLHVGTPLSLDRHHFIVVGIAVTAAFSPYPQMGCQVTCSLGSVQLDGNDTGLVWTTVAAAEALATPKVPLTWFSDLRLVDPAHANALANALSNQGDSTSTAPYLESAQEIGFQDSNLVRNEQVVLLVGSWLLAILAVASVAVLVGGRMADQMRRVGLLKAVGGTPGLVAAVLMAEYVVLALAGALLGLAVGRLVVPALGSPGSGLLGTTPPPPFTWSTVGVVVAVALGVALLAALVPALRAAHTSTVRALADAARRPRRSRLLVALSTRLPVSLLFGVRVMARRLRRTLLSAASIFVTVSGIVAVLISHASLNASQFAGTSGLVDPRTQRADQVLGVVTLMLVALACINAAFITRAIASDSTHASAVSRALGATPRQVTVGLSAAQTLPATFGALLGIPGGLGLYELAKHKGSGSVTLPPAPDLVAVVVGTALVVALLTAVPARWGARRPVATVLQAELA